MKKSRPFLIFCSFAILPFLANFPFHKATQKKFHTKEELHSFKMMGGDTSLPTAFNDLFAGSGACNKCHGLDTSGVASVDLLGNDINVVDDWRATLMANSAKDPFWRAKVSHEIIVNPEHQEAVESKCITCHAPMGHFNGQHVNIDYQFWWLDIDPVAQDGVSCVICHQQSEKQLGHLHSGNLNFDTSKVAYGPYEDPLVSPMFTATGYEPVFSEHISDAGICAGCHTLITETVDLEGNYTGGTFVEQATYHEWLNSDYEKNNVTCQNCHMPALEKGLVTIVTGAKVEPRYPFYLHEMVGGNVTMLKLLQNNVAELCLTAAEEQFEEVIQKTIDMLQNRSIELEVNVLNRTLDTAFFELTVENKAGHKFPSGYPSRRAFIEFLVTNELGDTLFISGNRDVEFEVFGQNSDYEPHFDMINSEEQVQIYELVMGDVNGNVTTVLERADKPIKDNRIPPKGFSSAHQVYDTTLIAGNALLDDNFNYQDGEEGSATDKIFYHIPLSDFPDKVLARATIYYQPLPPKWMEEMFAESSPEIDTFKTMFEETDRSPILMKESQIWVDGVTSTFSSDEERIITVRPTIAENGLFNIYSFKKHDLFISDLEGKTILIQKNNFGDYKINLSAYKGVFFLKFVNEDGKVELIKVIAK